MLVWLAGRILDIKLRSAEVSTELGKGALCSKIGKQIKH